MPVRERCLSCATAVALDMRSPDLTCVNRDSEAHGSIVLPEHHCEWYAPETLDDEFTDGEGLVVR